MKQLTVAILALMSLALGACSTPTGTASVATSPTASPTVTAVNTADMEKKVIDLEKKTWDDFVNKKYDQASSVNAPGFQNIYFGKVKSQQESTEDNKSIEVKAISFSDWKATFPTKDVAILTYKSTGKSSFKGKDTSGTYVISSVWVNINGEWKQALYHETKAEPQPGK